MTNISVTTKSGTHIENIQWEEAELSIGKSKQCDLILHGWKVDKVHAKILNSDGQLGVYTQENSKIFVNSKKVVGSSELQSGDEIAIGDYLIKINNFNPASRNADFLPSLPIDELCPSIES